MPKFLKKVLEVGLDWQWGWLKGKRDKTLVYDSFSLGYFSLWIENHLDFTDWREKYSLEWNWNE